MAYSLDVLNNWPDMRLECAHTPECVARHWTATQLANRLHIFGTNSNRFPPIDLLFVVSKLQNSMRAVEY